MRPALLLTDGKYQRVGGVVLLQGKAPIAFLGMECFSSRRVDVDQIPDQSAQLTDIGVVVIRRR